MMSSVVHCYSQNVGALRSLNLIEGNNIPAGGIASIIRDLKKHAIKHRRACACLVGQESSTEDLVALLEATNNFDPSKCLSAIHIVTEDLCKEIAKWL
jgi:hypothetical protein